MHETHPFWPFGVIILIYLKPHINVTPQQRTWKTLHSSKIPWKYLTFTFGEIRFTFWRIRFFWGNSGLLRGFSKILGFWGSIFCCWGVMGTLWGVGVFEKRLAMMVAEWFLKASQHHQVSHSKCSKDILDTDLFLPTQRTLPELLHQQRPWATCQISDAERPDKMEFPADVHSVGWAPHLNLTCVQCHCALTTHCTPLIKRADCPKPLVLQCFVSSTPLN